MRILEINIQNFRKLLQCHIEFSEKTTLFVGANNSGKTSAMDALGKFLADRNFTFNDITISERSAINVIGERWIQKDCEEPTTITEWESLIPTLVIADIDSAEATGHHKAICPERGKGFISSNYTITKWLIKEKDLDKLLSLPFEKKEIFKETPYKYSVRVAYQTPVSIAYEGNDEEAIHQCSLR